MTWEVLPSHFHVIIAFVEFTSEVVDVVSDDLLLSRRLWIATEVGGMLLHMTAFDVPTKCFRPHTLTT
jgi:hypothetical protein